MRRFGQFLGGVIGAVLFLGGSLYGAVYGGGTGTEANPYQIRSAANWQTLTATQTDWSKHFILHADIDLAGIAISPVGNGNIKFTGVLDGNGHTLSNAVIHQPTLYHVGLFGYIGTGGAVRNLGLASVSMQGYNSVGGIAAINSGTISSCFVMGTVRGSSGYAGGVAGQVDGGTITNCYATGTINGGSGQAGGLTGRNYNGTVSTSYSTAAVSGGGFVGGVVGHQFSAVTQACLWDMQTSGTADGVGNMSPDPAGAAGKTTAEMHDENTFLSFGWDFSATDGDAADWKMLPTGYPRLEWEYVPTCGDADHPYPAMDFNHDCWVDLADFAEFAAHWLECTAPECD